MSGVWSERRDFQRILKKILLVDLKKKSYEKIEMKLNSTGGSSLARELLSSFEDSLVIAPGLLTGTPAPTGGRYSIGMKTEHGYHVSSIGGFIGAYIKGYGIDGIVIKGRSNEVLIIRFDSNGVSFDPALEFLRDNVLKVANALEKDGKKSIVIGPAGENGSNISSLISEKFRSFGRGSGSVLFKMGVKAVVFSPAKFALKNDSFTRESMKIRKKLRAKDESVKRYGHPCYGCPISCAAMEGKLKKGISRILRDHEDPERIVNMANDFGVDLFGAHLTSKSCGCSIEEVMEMAKDGKSFDVEYPESEPDEWKEYLNSLGLCMDASKLLQEEDIESLHLSFISVM